MQIKLTLLRVETRILHHLGGKKFHGNLSKHVLQKGRSWREIIGDYSGVICARKLRTLIGLGKGKHRVFSVYWSKIFS